jgi:hypothetical protein
MNAEVKEKWLNALRSGEYKQGRYALKSINGFFCCLGVLCDLYSKEFYAPWEYVGHSEMMQFMGDLGHLPSPVRAWAGITSRNPVLYPGGETLVSLNDEKQLNFNEIANIIEEHL